MFVDRLNDAYVITITSWDSEYNTKNFDKVISKSWGAWILEIHLFVRKVTASKMTDILSR